MHSVQTRCKAHPAFTPDNCPSCGTSRPIGMTTEQALAHDGHGRCSTCNRLSYSVQSFGWCPWCDKGAPTPSPRHRKVIL